MRWSVFVCVVVCGCVCVGVCSPERYGRSTDTATGQVSGHPRIGHLRTHEYSCQGTLYIQGFFDVKEALYI